MEEHKIVFKGEMQMAAWGDSSTTGPWVKLWVHPEDLEHFKLLRLRKGNKEAGTRLGTVMVEIGEDEAVVEQKPAPYKRPNVGDLARVAVMWCKSEVFRTWADQQGQMAVLTEEHAKQFILGMCGVTRKYGDAASRKHLDVDPECGELFHQRVRIPFRNYLQQEGLEP